MTQQCGDCKQRASACWIDSSAPASTETQNLIRLFRLHHFSGWTSASSVEPRRHRPVFGRPDFVFPKLKIAVFVDGCFWHQCPRHSNVPANNRPFWARKLAANCARDRLVGRTLRADGWRVVRVWEHELARRNEPRLLRRIRRAMQAGESNRG